MTESTKAKMTSTLIEAIDKWMNKHVEKDYWASEVGFCPDDLTGLMARAAMFVIEVNCAANATDRG